MATQQVLLSLGFSRQEYGSRLSFSSPMHACMPGHFNHVRLCATLWTAAHQAPLPTGFSRQELEWVVLSYLKSFLSWVIHSLLWYFNQLSRISKSILAIKKKNSSEIYLRRSANFLKSSGHFDGRPLSNGYWRENIQLGLKKFAFSAGNWKRRCC